ncbi:hypothetical protein [Neobacillus fumarioli]|uniref:hypothetical protein n=1 Tax=Neobacillus fumarioli TaxID=105229 RepID=UPI000830FEF3|nr:hypothetical protein [Neobacillus fumarioli]
MLKLVLNNQINKPFPILDDDYIEKMANFYTSEAAKVLYPDLHKIPFENWLYRQYFATFENTSS